MNSELELPKNISKAEVITTVSTVIGEYGYEVVDQDLERPWGGFFRFGKDNVSNFNDRFFNGKILITEEELSPKLLMISPNSRLSWQDHERRSEIWTVVTGTVGVMLSENDEQPKEPTIYSKGQTIVIPEHFRHRLIGLNEWAIVAEIWKHTDPNNPSTEDDVRRIADDFGR